MLSIEYVIWATGLTGLAVVIGDRVVRPMLELAQSQYALNAHAVELITQAAQVCQ